MWTVYVHIFPNMKYYVGITSKTAQNRWGHKGHNYIRQTYLYNAITKYGWDNIQHEIIAEHLTEKEAKNFERILIQKLNCKKPNGYNLTDGGDGVKGFGCFGEKNGMYGKHHSAETLEKISKARKNKLVGEDNYWYGKHLPEETKQKIREKHLGKTISKEVIAKIIEKQNKAVYQIDIQTNQIINQFISMKVAADTLNIDRGSINKCCLHQRKSAGGFKWEYVETN